MAAPSDSAAPPKTTFSALAVFAERRTLVMLALGFSSGLPFYLVFDTLSAWLRDDGLSLEIIGYFSLATLVYSFKFLWAPLVDRTTIPVLTGWLGHRRSWMLLCQALIMVGLWLIAGGNPQTALGTMAVFAILTGFAGATQDVVLDAWRIEVADESRQGPMAAAYQWGFRVALLVSGALPLILAQAYSWQLSYAVMAALMLVGMTATLLAPREAQHAVRPIDTKGARRAPLADAIEWVFRFFILFVAAILLGAGLAANPAPLALPLGFFGLDGGAEWITTAWRSPNGVWYQVGSVLAGFAVIALAITPMPGMRTRPGVYLFSALAEPLFDFLRRYKGVAAMILALICVYRLPDFVLNIMNPFYLDLGFTLVEVAEVRKIFGLVASVLGVFAGGLLVARLGLMPALVIGAFAAPISNLVFIWLAMQGHDLSALFIAISIDNILAGLSGTALIAYMSSLTAAGFTATQYALFSSLYALPGRLIASQSGRLVETAAQNAEPGGPFSALTGLFAGLPPETYAQAFEKSGVSPAALGAGYVVFFIYSALIGIAAIILALIVASREGKRREQTAHTAAAGMPAPPIAKPSR
jgi:PAT family beta-lactamase induction signal transducer AmpG